MELDDPQVMPAPPAPLPHPGWMEELEARVAVLNSASPQRENAVRRAFAAIREGLALLAAHGHQMHLVESQAPPPQTFPQMLYKAGMEMTVHSAEDRDTAFADGWTDHPSKTGTVAAKAQEQETEEEKHAQEEAEWLERERLERERIEALTAESSGSEANPVPSGGDAGGSGEDSQSAI